MYGICLIPGTHARVRYLRGRVRDAEIEFWNQEPGFSFCRRLYLASPLGTSSSSACLACLTCVVRFRIWEDAQWQRPWFRLTSGID